VSLNAAKFLSVECRQCANGIGSVGLPGGNALRRNGYGKDNQAKETTGL
jgi:hypothetical protein